MAQEQTTNKTIANEIIQQLGGNKFITMTGSNDFLIIDNGIKMQLSKNQTQCNRLEITLNGMDLYDLKFYKVIIRDYINPEITHIKEYKNIYNDQLQEMFTRHTGLYTRLF